MKCDKERMAHKYFTISGLFSESYKRGTYVYNGILEYLVPVRTSFGLPRHSGTMYQHKVDVDMLEL